jgi:hypothetical protein
MPSRRSARNRAADDQQIGDQLQPEPVAQHPERAEQERPEMESVAHEANARGVRQRIVVVALRRLVDGVDGHNELSIVARMERSGMRGARG